MKPIIVGIIAEYNPLHNGHVYHIQKTIELLHPDYVICVMSGNYTQRGEPALVSKQVRTECALKCGIDCVVELPFIYATASAEFFASAGVSVLNSLGCVTHISFGCETPDIEILNSIATVLINEPVEFTEILKNHLEVGMGFAAAREKALHSIIPDDPGKVVSGSNNILAIEYIKALKRLNSSIIPLPVLRVGADYTDTSFEHVFSSAMAIRSEIKKKQYISERVKNFIPECTNSLILKEIESGRCPIDSIKLYHFLQIFLRSIKPEQLDLYPFMEPGLGNRLLKAIKNTSSISDIVKNTVSKRYPATRIQRLLLNILSGLTQEDFDRYVRQPVPYARILGFNTTKTELQGLIKRSSSIPVVTKTSDINNLNKVNVKEIFGYEARTTDIYRYLSCSSNNTAPSEYEYQIIKVKRE